MLATSTYPQTAWNQKAEIPKTSPVTSPPISQKKVQELIMQVSCEPPPNPVFNHCLKAITGFESWVQATHSPCLACAVNLPLFQTLTFQFSLTMSGTWNELEFHNIGTDRGTTSEGTPQSPQTPVWRRSYENTSGPELNTWKCLGLRQKTLDSEGIGNLWAQWQRCQHSVGPAHLSGYQWGCSGPALITLQGMPPKMCKIGYPSICNACLQREA